MEFELRALSYSQVGPRRTDEQFPAHALVKSKLNARVVERFTNYFARCFESDEKAFHEVKFTTSDGRFLKRKLDELRKLDQTGSQARRKEITQEVAAKLSEKMSASGTALPGALFAIHMAVDRREHVALIKLDLNEREIIALHDADEAEVDDIVYQLFTKALPDDADNFRKGVVYPSRGDGDARSGQFDTDADYWERFVGGTPVREARRASELALEALREAKLEAGGELGEKEVIKFMEAVAQTPSLTPEKLAAIAAEHTAVRKRPANLANKFREKLGKTSTALFAPVEAFVYRFSHGVTLKVRAREIGAGLVTVTQEGRDVLIRIKQSDIVREEQIGRPR